MPRGMRRMGREVEVEAAVSPQILLKEEEEVGVELVDIPYRYV